MNNRVKAYIDGMFAGVPLEGEAAELYEELCANCAERYEDLIRQGYADDDAFAFVREGMGDIEELIAPYRPAHAPSTPPRTETETAPYFEQAFDVTGVTGIEVDARYESVSVLPNSGEELVVLYERDDGMPFEAPVITCEDGVIRVETPRHENISFSLNAGLTLQSILNAIKGKSGSARLTLGVPQGMMPHLSVKGGSGSLRLEGVALRGADVHLSSGAIRMETDARVRGGVYELHTASGSIRCSAAAEEIILNAMSGSVKASCDAYRLSAHAVSGSVRVEGRIGEVEAKSVSGSVHVTLANTEVRQIQAHSVSGSVHITIPEGVTGATLNCKSASGRVHNAFGASVWGDGAAQITATSTSGSVHIERI